MRSALVLLAVVLLPGAFDFQVSAQDVSVGAILTPQRLRRLQRDSQRQTDRWLNFKTRVESVPDSPERGFELALYYAVTHDADRGKAAIDWALSHRCDPRQFSLILDWCGDLLTDEQRQKVTVLNCAAKPDSSLQAVIAGLQSGGFTDAHQLYGAAEWLIVHRDARSQLADEQAQFLRALPVEFLLSLKPADADHPDWMTHVAALALVAVDPNLEGSQFLQSWALEERQMLRDGPGVAYEFLWADPYLPGIGYQNMDPWVHDASGRLFARADWDPHACWVSIAPGRVAQQNCPPEWRDKPAQFGRLTLVPMTHRCQDVASPQSGAAFVLWGLSPGQSVVLTESGHSRTMQSDPAGMVVIHGLAAFRACPSR